MSKNLRFTTMFGMLALFLAFGTGVKGQVLSSEKKLLTYSVTLEGFEYTAPVNELAKTVDFTVPFGTAEHIAPFDQLNLVGDFTLSPGATMTHSEDPTIPQDPGVTENDFSDPVAFTVHAEDGSTVEYFVTITEAPNGCNNIGTINLVSTRTDCYDGDHDVSEWFEMGEHNHWTVTVPFGTDLDDVDLTITDADDCPGDWTIDPSTFTFDVDTPLMVTVTAPNMISQQVYYLTVSEEDASDENMMTKFYFMASEFNGQAADTVKGVIDQNAQRIDVKVPYNLTPYGDKVFDLTMLDACFEHSAFSCVYVIGPGTVDKTLQNTCVTPNDFTEPVHYTVIAQDDSERYYNVFVTMELPDEDNSIMNLMATGLLDCNDHDVKTMIMPGDGEGEFMIRLPMRDEDPDITVTYEIPELAAATPASGGFDLLAEAVDDTVSIVVTSEKGVDATYKLAIMWEEPSAVKELTAFSFEPYAMVEGEPTGNMQFTSGYAVDPADFEDANPFELTVEVPFGTDLTELVATFTLNDMYASMSHSEDMQSVLTSGDVDNHLDYTTPVAFTVFAEDCSTVEYFVTVVPAEEKVGTGIDFAVNGTQYDKCDCGFMAPVTSADVTFVENAVELMVPAGTVLDSLTLVVDEGSVVTGDDVMVEEGVYYMLNVSGTVEVTVTAENTVDFETYTITVVEDEESDENMLEEFYFTQVSNPGLEVDMIEGVIDQEKNRIDVQVPFGTPEMLIVDFVQSPLACVFLNGPVDTDAVEQCSGDAPAVDFSTYQTYTVIAQNGDEAYYNVYVEVLPADEDNELTNFMVNDLEECFGELTYDVAGDIDGMEITVSVSNGTDVTALDVSFDIPEKASVSPSEGVHDFTNPVTFTVTAQNGDEADYVVTVVPRDQNSEKMIKSFEFKQSINGFAAVGSINQTDKIIEVWVPWKTDVTELVATFTLSDGAKMTHSEDEQIIQYSGVTPNNFITPVAYTVWAEDCSRLEYFVIVNVTPDTNTGISQFVIDYTGCFCDEDAEHIKIDNYAKRVWVQIPYADEDGEPISLKALDVLTIGLAEGATVDPEEGTMDFSKGAVKYTVTAPDGVTKVDWMVMVENPPCTGTDILDWDFVGEDLQVEWTWLDDDDDEHVMVNPVIDTENHTVTVMVLPGTDLSSMFANATLECGATICCSAGSCAGNEIDFSGEGNCHTCVVTAQDKSITQDWTICVKVADVEKPVSYTNSVLAQNCADSVMVWGDKDGGTIYLVNETTANQISAMVNSWTTSISTLAQMQDWLQMNMDARNLIDDAVDAHMGAGADYPYADSTTFVMTDGLYSGLYYAILVDAAGNVSCSSDEAVFIDQCVVTVADLCALRDASPVYTYVVEGEVLVSYEEGNYKFIQDDGCGIKVVDDKGAWKSTYGVGTGLTNIKGTIDKTGVHYVFTPVCCYSPDETSTNNTIDPVMLTWDEFVADCYNSYRGYESMLVRITDPIIAVDDYGLSYDTWEFDGLDLYTYNALGDDAYLIQKVFGDPDYIGEEIPTVPTIYQGIRTNVDWPAAWGGRSGLLTPRDLDDIIKVDEGILIADPDPAKVAGVIPGNCGPVTITILNQGVGNLTISALYLDDAVGTDEFNIVDPAQVPFTLGTWESMDVLVHFCPKNAGNESTTLLVEYGAGKVMEVPINGTTVSIFDAPYFTNLNNNTEGSLTGWTWDSNLVNQSRFGNNFEVGAGQSLWFGWFYATPQGGGRDVYITSPGIDLGSLSRPVVKFWLGTYFNSTIDVQVSTDMQQTWTVVKDYGVYTNGNGVGKWMEIDLSDFVGETIFIRWHSNPANYWGIDNVEVSNKITEPVFAVSPDPGDFGGVQVGESASLSFSITNVGVSILNVKKVELMAGPTFALVDTLNSYPVEVTSTSYAYAVDDGKTSVDFDVTFTPSDIGVFTGKVLVTYGMFGDMVAEIDLVGEGLSCSTATEAFVGENWAASQNSWFTYTAEKFQIVSINSCHPNQDVSDTQEYAYDTWLYVYSDCEGTLLAENDDMGWDGCVYNRASSGVTFAMNEGETVKIFWPWEFTSAYDDEGFYFNIDPSYPVDGDVCETAIPLTLPVVNHFGSTVTFADDYDMSPCSPFSNYMDGNDKVYSVTIDVEGYLTANILGAYGSVHVLDECPVEELEKRNCKLFASGPNGGEQTKRIQPGTYYVIVSTWAPPQTVDYLLNMSFEELSTGIDDAGLMSNLVVYPNPTQGMFTVSISNAEASDLTLELVNISGQTVYRNEVKSVYSYNEDIDASSFAKGVYYLKVNNGEEVKIEKVVIQ